MSSVTYWGSELRPATQKAGIAMMRSEAVIDNRLDTLREVALTLLREVESLRVSQEAAEKRHLRLHDEVRRFEIDLIRSALGRTSGNQTRAARLLGVKLTTLNTKIKRYKIGDIDPDSLMESHT